MQRSGGRRGGLSKALKRKGEIKRGGGVEERERVDRKRQAVRAEHSPSDTPKDLFVRIITCCVATYRVCTILACCTDTVPLL